MDRFKLSLGFPHHQDAQGDERAEGGEEDDGGVKGQRRWPVSCTPQEQALGEWLQNKQDPSAAPRLHTA